MSLPSLVPLLVMWPLAAAPTPAPGAADPLASAGDEEDAAATGEAATTSASPTSSSPSPASSSATTTSTSSTASPPSTASTTTSSSAPPSTKTAEDDDADPLADGVADPRPWAVGGFVDTQYILNTNFPDNHVFRGTAVSSRTGEFSPNLIVAYFRHDPTKRAPYILEVALQYGAAVDALYAAEPDPGGDDGRPFGVEVWKHIGKAHAGFRLGKTEVDAGLMSAPTHFGSFWTKDNWHSSITWGYSSVPFYLAGLRVQHQFNDAFAIAGWVVNGYGTMGDANKAPSGMVSLFITPTDGLLITQNVYAGPEGQDLHPRAWRLLTDTQIIYDTERWSFAAVGDFGREQRTLDPGQPVALWANGMVSARVHLLGERHRWGIAARPEIFWERGGVIFGGPDPEKTLIAGTFTNDVRLWDALLLRVEYRYDQAFAASGFYYRGAAVTDDAPGLARRQHSVIFNVIGYFERLLPEGRRR
ncbi:MAG: outer membrane beta-barrel protein [Nannocystaceae bacterium]